MYNVSHLKGKDSYWALQNDEALCVYSLLKVLNPKTIVEFGFFRGFSTRNFLAGMSGDSRLYSYDPCPESAEYARRISDKRFKFYQKSGEKFNIKDIHEKQIDFVLIDADHKFKTSLTIFQRIQGYMSPMCVIAIHDTGLFNEDLKTSKWTTSEGFLIGRGYVIMPQERAFVNYIKKKYPDYQQIHLHSMRVGRVGLTLLQKYNHLSSDGRNYFSVSELLFHKYILGNIKRIKRSVKYIFNRLIL